MLKRNCVCIWKYKAPAFHFARHNFAIVVTFIKGVSIDFVSKMLVHRSIMTIQHYAKILYRKVGEDMKQIRGKYKIENPVLETRTCNNLR